MVPGGGTTSNTKADDLFEALEEWNTHLKAENFDFEKLSQGSENQPDLGSSRDEELTKKKPKRSNRSPIRRPSP